MDYGKLQMGDLTSDAHFTATACYDNTVKE